MPQAISFFGLRVSLYYLFWFFGVLVAFLLGMFLAKAYGISLSKAVIYTGISLVCSCFFIYLTSLIFNGEKTNGVSVVRGTAFLPFLYFLLSRLFREPYEKYTDFLAPIVVIYFGVLRIGCIFPGCCHGFPSCWGIYSNVAQEICFPVQIIEAVASLVIAATLIVMATKQIQQGKLLYWMLSLYGGMRFVLEFLSDNEKLWLNVSELALHALLTFIVGLFMLIATSTIFGKKGKV